MSMPDPWFDEIYKRNSPRLVKYAEGYFCDHYLAQDLAHEAFVVLIVAHNCGVIVQNPDSYLLAVLKNIIGSERQKMERRRVERLELKHEPYTAVEDKEKLEYYLPNWLSKQERQFLIWWIEEGRTMKEIGNILGCSEHACHARMNRLRAKYKKREKKGF